MTRILIAGYQHETNTFAPSLADWAAFNTGENFPAGKFSPVLNAAQSARLGANVLVSCW